MPVPSSRSGDGDEAIISSRAGDRCILSVIRSPNGKGLDEAQLCYFPFVATPGWYQDYWFQDHERRGRDFHFVKKLAGLAKWLHEAGGALPNRSVRPNHAQLTAFESCHAQATRGWMEA
jgi:hypothetical protein